MKLQQFFIIKIDFLTFTAFNLDDNICICDFEFTNFMGGICIALVLSDGSAVYLIGENTDSDNVKTKAT